MRFADVDLNEDSVEEADEDVDVDAASEENNEEEGDPSEFIDVLDVLDGRGDPDSGDDMGEVERQDQASAKGNREGAEEGDGEGVDEDMERSEEDSDEQSEDEEETGIVISASEGEEDEGGDSALQELEHFVSSLDAGQKRKALDEDDVQHGGDSKPARKRRLLPERTEAGAENEFAAALGASTMRIHRGVVLNCVLGGGKLNLDDLLAPLEGQSSNLQSLKKSAKVLTSTGGKIKTLSAPLPQRTAERLDREAAYEQTKEEIGKWKATMQRIQEV